SLNVFIMIDNFHHKTAIAMIIFGYLTRKLLCSYIKKFVYKVSQPPPQNHQHGKFPVYKESKNQIYGYKKSVFEGLHVLCTAIDNLPDLRKERVLHTPHIRLHKLIEVKAFHTLCQPCTHLQRNDL